MVGTDNERAGPWAQADVVSAIGGYDRSKRKMVVGASGSPNSPNSEHPTYSYASTVGCHRAESVLRFSCKMQQRSQRRHSESARQSMRGARLHVLRKGCTTTPRCCYSRLFCGRGHRCALLPVTSPGHSLTLLVAVECPFAPTAAQELNILSPAPTRVAGRARHSRARLPGGRSRGFLSY